MVLRGELVYVLIRMLPIRQLLSTLPEPLVYSPATRPSLSLSKLPQLIQQFLKHSVKRYSAEDLQLGNHLSMDSEVLAAPVTSNNSSEAEPSFTGSPRSKKSRGKVPKRIHKAEREKLKREHLNDLFLELAYALELTEQNNGKASILCETTRVVKDMLSQIECLKRENATLLSESQYVAVEKNELEDENSALQIQIRDLKSTLTERMLQHNLDLNVTPRETQGPQVTSYFQEGCLKFPVADPSLQQAPILNPVFIIPVCSDPKAHPDPEPEPAMLATKPISNVSKPHPRYPTPSDSWPFQILEKQSEFGKELEYSGREQVFGNL